MPAVASAASASELAGPSYQPFQCVICLKRFTRHENLKRHATLHSQPESSRTLSCDFCAATFSRQDLRRRHLKHKHPEQVPPVDDTSTAASTGPASTATRNGQSQMPDQGFAWSGPAGDQASAGHHGGGNGGGNGTSAVVAGWDYAMFDANGSGNGVGGHDRSASIPTAGQNIQENTFDQTFSYHPKGSRGSDASSFVPEYSTSSDVKAYGNGLPAPVNIPSMPTHSGGKGKARDVADSATSGREMFDWGPPRNNSSTDIGSYMSIPTNPSPGACNKCSPQRDASIPEDWSPTLTQITRGVSLFFSHAVRFFPFIHKATFSPTTAPDHLLLGMCCLGYQYGGDPDIVPQWDDNRNNPSSELETGHALSYKFYQAGCRVTADNESSGNDSKHKLVIVQAYILLQVYAMLYLGGDGSAEGLKMHSKIISLSRSSGLMQPLPTNTNPTADLDSLWREFVKAESHKRTMLKLHHLDALWYQLLSIPRSISHLEIKHDMPCYDSCWNVDTASEWAHRTLIANRTYQAIRYADAIRQFLAPAANVNVAQQMESQGVLNIIHFLQSSLREVSGWSTMTGSVSLERFETLNSSLTALEPHIRHRARSDSGSQWIAVEATWEMAMLETLSWSPSHMGGIVEVSIDAALATATCLASSRGFLVDPEIARSLHVHVDWFLRYLESTHDADSEPAFVSVYAYKAFLIGWQLLRSGTPNSMTAVGIGDGDSDAALAWAVKVFERRRTRLVGKLALQNLKSLTEADGAL